MPTGYTKNYAMCHQNIRLLRVPTTSFYQKCTQVDEGLSKGVVVFFWNCTISGTKWNGKPRLACISVRHPRSEVYVGALTWTCWSEWKWPNRYAGRQSNHTNALRLGRPDVLRSFSHYLRAQSQGHHTIDRLKERGMKRRSARWYSLKGREGDIVSQTNIKTIWKATYCGNF